MRKLVIRHSRKQSDATELARKLAPSTKMLSLKMNVRYYETLAKLAKTYNVPAGRLAKAIIEDYIETETGHKGN